MEIIPIAFILAILTIAVWQYIDHRRTMKKYDRMQAEAQKREREAISELQAATKAISDKTVELFQSLGGEPWIE